MRSMPYALFVVAGIFVLLGLLIFGSAKSVMHEILGSLGLLIAAVLVVGGSLIRSVNEQGDKLARMMSRYEDGKK